MTTTPERRQQNQAHRDLVTRALAFAAHGHPELPAGFMSDAEDCLTGTLSDLEHQVAARFVDAFMRHQRGDLNTEEFEGTFYEAMTPSQQMERAVAKQNARTAQVRSERMEWIAVGERMPENGQGVMFWVSDWLPTATPGVGNYYYDDERGQRWNDDTQMEGLEGDEPKRYYTKGFTAQGVTHWQPLPQPPKPESEAK